METIVKLTFLQVFSASDPVLFPERGKCESWYFTVRWSPSDVLSTRSRSTWHQQNANEMTRVRFHSPTLGSSWISTVWTFYFFWPKTKQQGRWINEKSCHNMWTHDWQWSEFCQWARLGDVDGLLLTTETTPLHSLFCSFHPRWQQAPLMIDDWESGKCPRLFADDCFLLLFCYGLSLGLLLSVEECQQQEGN